MSDSRKVSARGVVRAGVWIFRTPPASLSAAAPWEHRGSVSGARRAGFTSTSNVDRQSVHAGEADSKDESCLCRFPLVHRGSVSGAWRTGFPMATSDDRQSVHAGKTDSRGVERRAPVGDRQLWWQSARTAPVFKRTCAYAQVPR